MGFRTIKALSQSLDDDGATWTSHFYKTGGPASFSAAKWADMSMGAGIPKYNAYVGSQFTATALYNQGNEGIYLGPAPPAGQTKHLSEIQMRSTSSTVAPATFVLCDYLLFYPLIDGDDTAQQDMINIETLPRYQSGDGVMMMLVCTTPMTTNPTVTISYTNQAGVSGRTSTSTLVTHLFVGRLLCSSDTSNQANAISPFVPLQGGDTGVRSVESVTHNLSAGGFYALVLVRPLAWVEMREQNTVTEIDFVQQKAGCMPRIYDGAYLNFIYMPNQSGTAVPLMGYLTFAWR